MTVQLAVPGARVVADEMAPRCSVPGFVPSPAMATTTVSAAAPVLRPVVAAFVTAQLSAVTCVLPAQLACALLARVGVLSLLAYSPLAAASDPHPIRRRAKARRHRRCLLLRH